MRLSATIEASTKDAAESRIGDQGLLQCDSFFRTSRVSVEPVTEEQALLARQGYSDYGKGRHPSGLNFGDCFSYALAKSTGEPLLFKGEDFRQTDIQSALE